MLSILNSSFYVLFYLIIFFLTLSYTERREKSIDIIFNLSIDYLFCFLLGFRGLILSDWTSYLPAYNQIPNLFHFFDIIDNLYPYSTWERGFTFIMSLAKTFSVNYIFFQTCLFLFEYFIIKEIFKDYFNKKYYFCFPFFFLFGCIQITINFLRQGIAIIIFFYSIRYIFEKKMIKYLCCVFIASLFHRSAFIYIPLYFILRINISSKLLWGFFLIGNIIYIFQIPFITPIIWNLAQKYGGIFGVYAGRYLGSTVYANSTGITLGYIERTITFCIVILNRKKIETLLPRGLILENIMYIYLFSYLYLSELYILIERIPFMFIFAYWIIYPFILFSIKTKNKNKIVLVFLVYGVLKLAMSFRHESSLYNHCIKYILDNSSVLEL